MEKAKDKEEYDQSLSEWKEKLQASLPKRPDWPGAAHEASDPSSRQPYAPRYSQQPTRALRHGDYTRRTRPLIDKVTNGWREEKVPSFYVPEADDQDPRCCDLEDEGSCPNTTRGLARSRRFRRMIAMLLLLALVLWYSWKWYLRPHFQEEWDFKQGFMPARTNGTYGIARGGHFEGIFIQDLDPSLVPGGTADPEGKRRLVFVGDIHGCKDELLHLLEKVGFDRATDHLIPTGDVVSKGPDNVGVLDELIRLKADSVRGNHEDRLLEAAKTLLGTNLPPQSAAATSQGYSKDAQILKELKPRHMQYLRDMPLMLRIPALPHASASPWRSKHKDRIAEEIIVAHAGIVPHVPLRKQDPYFVMNMRSIDHRTHLPSALHETKKGHSRPWIRLWNWYNDRLFHGRSIKGFHLYSLAEYQDEQAEENEGWLGSLWFGRGRGPKPKPQVVVYGHDSKAGLQMHRWSKGLDSGCVRGGKLTAMVMDAGGRVEVVHVGCRDYKKA